MTGLDPVFAWVATGLLSAIFAAAAWHKFRAPNEFASVLGDYRVLPAAIAATLAPVVPFAEALVAIGLWVPASRALAAAAAAALLGTYAAAIGLNLFRGRRSIDCGCTWGGGTAGLSGWLLIRNAALLLPCALVVLERTPRSVSWIDALTAFAGIAVLCLCYRSFETLVAHLPSLQQLEGRA